MLSINLGNQNLAWVFLLHYKDHTKEKHIIEFGIINLDEIIYKGDSIIIHWCQKVCEFFSDRFDRCHNIRTLIVETPIRFNDFCNNLLYAVSSSRLLIEKLLFFSCKTIPSFDGGSVYCFHFGKLTFNIVCGYDCKTTFDNTCQFCLLITSDDLTVSLNFYAISLLSCINLNYIFFFKNIRWLWNNFSTINKFIK
jgi:hypothetical protein